MKKVKLDEKFFINIFIIVVIVVFYALAAYALLSFLFWPNNALNFLDYIIEIVSYSILATLLLFKREIIVNKLVS